MAATPESDPRSMPSQVLWPTPVRLLPTLATALFIVGMASAMACQKASPEARDVDAAFSELQRALFTGDAGALYDMSVPELRAEVAALRERIAAAVELVEGNYSTEEAQAIKKDIGGTLLEGAESDRDLYIAIADMRGIRHNETVDEGLKHDPASVRGSEATIQTKAGDVFRFVKGDDGIWRTDVALEGFRKWPAIATIEKNIVQVRKNVDAMRRQRDLLRDPRTPEGAFNLFREAVVGQNMDVVYTLLSAKTKAHLRSALDLYGKLPDDVRKEGPAKVPEPLRAGLSRAEGVRSLLQEIAQTEILNDALSVSAADRVDHVDRTGDTAVVTTTGGREVHLERGDKDVWRIVDLESWAQTALVEPLSLPAPEAPATP